MFLSMFKSFVSYQDGKVFHKRSHEWHSTIAGVLKTYPKNVFKGLPIIPVGAGKWIEFGNQIHFPPSNDLDELSKTVLSSLKGMDFVCSDLASGSRQDFFEHLGVSKIDARQICVAIEKEHLGATSQAPSSDASVLLAHAKYLFIHRDRRKAIPEVGKVCLWMTTQALIPARSNTIYLDDPAEKVRMGTILPASMQDRLLNDSFVSAYTGIESRAWIHWLKTVYSLSCRLQVVSDGRISGDLKEVVKFQSSKQWLKVLVHEWGQVEKAKKKDTDAAQILRDDADGSRLMDTMVQTVGGGMTQLRSTYLPTDDLLNMKDPTVPYLNIDDPNASIWQTLHQLGVVCTTNEVDHILKALRGLKADDKTELDVLRRMYEDLGRLLINKDAVEEHLPTVTAFFRDEAHIWDSDKSCWRVLGDCVWAGDFKLEFKFQVGDVYDSCSILFKEMLKMKDTDVEEVLKDIAARPDPKDWTDVPRMIALLKDLTRYITKLGVAASAEQFKNVKSSHEDVLKKGLIPIKIPIFEMRKVQHRAPKAKLPGSSSGDDQGLEEPPMKKKLIRTDLEFWGLAKMELYLVCDRQKWEKSFNRINVVDCNAEDGRALTPMFETMIAAFNSQPNFVRMMSLPLEERPKPGHATVLDVQITNAFRSKMVLIKRVVEENTASLRDDLKKKLGVLERIEIHTSPNIEIQPFIILQGNNRFEHFGLATKGGQFMPRQAYEDGRFEVYADRKRISNQVPFVHQLHKDLVDWLSITSSDIKDFMRDIFASEDHDTTVESLKLAGIDMDDLPIPEVAKASSINPVQPQTNGHRQGQGSEASTNGINGTTTSGDSPAEMFPASDANPVLTDRARELAAAADAFKENCKQVKAKLAVPSVPKSSFFAGITRESSDEKKSPDPQAGLEGELFVFKLLTKVLQLQGSQHISVGRRIWTSELRHKAGEKLAEWVPTDASKPYADFTVHDKLGLLSRWLALSGINNPGKGATYHIEVKASKGGIAEEYHFSDLQMGFARDVSINRRGKEMFLFFRVYDLKATPDLKIIADPWDGFANSKLAFRSAEGWIGKVEG